MTIDGRVTGLNQDVFRAVQRSHALNPNGTKTESDAQTIRNAILKDNKIDAAEQDLLDELAQGNGGKLTISAQPSANFNPRDIQLTNSFTQAGKTVLKNVKPQGSIDDLELTWRKGNSGFKELVELYNSSPANASKVKAFLRAKLEKAWDQSTVSNAYSPLRDVIAYGYNGVNQLQGQDNARGRTMLYEAISETDRANNDSIPDFLYNWVRPGGYL